ncbi:TraB/GumN family protein [Paenibacillus radicis (ex Xue et al. 2023)]|uniref:TraB/GumN family protein n=1 Tax=Paenibacillus radicis (ex Xue et al. 2023) TaxID=2972489 RepID=A0ABT1YJ05_9BACL|nr:TraB/GumN family protein [Paenibacillus radicis (ex Xue et al. 2023)]MCR8633176.1 TraB/GumN family protein [Paenibacillus radicis (ex Xue et al. 2023)]
MKKISVLFLSLFLFASVFSSVHAAENALSIWLNGEQIQFSKSEPILENGVTLVPMRPILEKLDVKVNWDEATQIVSDAKEGLSFSLQIGSTNAIANGKAVKLEAAPKLIQNVTYVPLRFVAETVGYQVAWNQSLRQVSLTSKQQSDGSRGFLWKVENKGNTVYLLGSIHYVLEGMYPLRPEIENAFQAADYLGVEVDLSKVAPEELQKQILELGVYKDGSTLKDHVSAEIYNKVTALLKANGLPENSFDSFKPWFVQQNILGIIVGKEGYQSEIGIDQYLIDKANKAKKPVISLESIDSQFQTNNNYSDSLQEKLLLQTLDPSSGVTLAPNGGIDDLAKMWKEGDYNALHEYTNSSDWDAEYHKALLTDRNVEMAEKIKSYLNSDKKETYMVVVGMLHTLGDQGVAPLLEKEGFTVERQ